MLNISSVFSVQKSGTVTVTETVTGFCKTFCCFIPNAYSKGN
jgi:hypothetical protein